MDWVFLICCVICVAAGWWGCSHKAYIEAKAASAIARATTTHTGTPLDPALKTIGQDIDKALAPASAVTVTPALTATAAVHDPAVVAALAGAVAASR